MTWQLVNYLYLGYSGQKLSPHSVEVFPSYEQLNDHCA
jgi:hypothetical protein